MDFEGLAEALRRARRQRDVFPRGSDEWRQAQRLVDQLIERLVREAAVVA